MCELYANHISSARLLDGLRSRAVHRVAVVLAKRQQRCIGERIQQLPSGSRPILPQGGAERKSDDQQEPRTVGEPTLQSNEDEHADHSLGEWEADAEEIHQPRGQRCLCELRDEFSREPGSPAVDATRAMNGYVDAEENAQEQVGEISIRGLLGRSQHVSYGD